MSRITFVIPVRTRSALNLREHFRARAERVKAEREATWANFNTDMRANRARTLLRAGPLVVTMTRVAPSALDSDNLPGAMKGVRDQLAVQLGIDDRNPRVTWRVEQVRGQVRQHLVRVCIEPLANVCPTCGAVVTIEART